MNLICNNCSNSFNTIYKCNSCKKEICNNCVGRQVGHTFIIHSYCKECSLVSHSFDTSR